MANAQTVALAKEHLALQQAVIDSLPANQDFIHVKSLQDWIDYLESPHHRVLSIRENGKLISHAVIIFPDQNFPDADMLNMNLPAPYEQLSTLTAVATHPAYRGRDLMNKLIDKWIDVTQQEGRKHLLALITTDNYRSWTQFLKVGMNITGAGFDPSDNSTTYYAHRDLSKKTLRPDFNKASTVKIVLGPEADLNTMNQLFSLGFVGFEAEKDCNQRYTGNLVLAKRPVAK